MSKFLTVYDDAAKTFEALDPKNATGIGLPAFTTGTALPAAGQVVGEGFMNTATRTGYIWDGTRWQPIVPSALLNYPTDAALLADRSQSPGSYGVSQATGNLFISMAGGAWHQVGVRSYATETAMKADLSAIEGDTAWSKDTNQLWYFNTGKWWTLGTAYYATEAALIADMSNVAGGGVACALDTGLLFSCPTSLPNNWQPMSIAQFATEAGMRAKTTDNVPHQIAITQDTNRIYVWTGTRWMGSPVEYFATEAALLAAAADAGTLGIAGDTAKAYIRTASAWQALAGPTITSGTALPTTGMATGDMFYNLTTKTLYVRGSSTWDAVSGGATVSATAPATPQTGQLWLDTTAKELKTWNGTGWALAYEGFSRVGDGQFKIDATTAGDASFALYNTSPACNFGIVTRAGAGPQFTCMNGGDAHDIPFMDVNLDHSVTFPHGVKGGAVVVSETSTPSPNTGAAWYQNSTQTLKVYNGTAWVPAGGGGRKTANLTPSSAIANGDVVFDFPAGSRPTRYIRVSGWLYPSAASCIIVPAVHQVTSLWRNLSDSSIVNHSQNMVCWESGGTKDVHPTFQTNHGSAITFKNVANHDVKAETYCWIEMEAFISGGDTVRMKWHANYTSPNDGQMVADGGMSLSLASGEAIDKFGFNCRQYNALNTARSMWCGLEFEWE